MVDILTIGIPGPTGPGAVAPGVIITARGDLIYGNASAVAARLAKGTAGQYLRSNGTDLLWSAILAGDLPAAIDAVKLGGGALTNAKLAFLATITSDVQAQLDAKAAASHTHLTNTSRGIYVDKDSTSAAATDNTASVSTWATAMDHSMVLPTGHWSVKAVGGISLKHGASGVSEGRVTVDGQDSTERLSGALSSTLWIPLIDDDDKADCTGTVHIRVQFRTNSAFAGTTYARNPWFMAIAERIS